MNFAYTILYVKDVPRAVGFYEKAFELTRRFVNDTNEYAEMETGATTLAFVANEFVRPGIPGGFLENGLSHPPAGIEITFTTLDVATAFAQAVGAGAIAVAEPKQKPWGQVVAYVRDLDGVLVEIASPM